MRQCLCRSKRDIKQNIDNSYKTPDFFRTPVFFMVRATGLDLHFRHRRKLRFRCVQPQQATLIRVAFKWVRVLFFCKNKKERHWPLFFVWCGQQDSNLHGRPLEPKSNVSANSTMPANMSGLFYHAGTALSMCNLRRQKRRCSDTLFPSPQADRQAASAENRVPPQALLSWATHVFFIYRM